MALPGNSLILDPKTKEPFRQNGGPPDDFSIPHVYTQQAVISGSYRTYYHLWDEAQRHAHEDAMVMKRDAFLLGILQERKLAVAGLAWDIEVDDEKDPHQSEMKRGLTKIVRAVPNFQRLL